MGLQINLVRRDTYTYYEKLISGDFKISHSTTEMSPSFEIPKELSIFCDEHCCSEFNRKSHHAAICVRDKSYLSQCL